MKAISLWQPWASLIASGAKKIETRGWYTGYRGPILIHAAKRKLTKTDLEGLVSSGGWLNAFGWSSCECRAIIEKLHNLPYGALVAMANLRDCKRVERIPVNSLHEDRGGYCEWILGNYESGRYGWILEDVRAIEEPIIYKGQQGFFDVDNSLLHGINYKWVG